MMRVITGSILISIGVYVFKNGSLPLFIFLSTIGCVAFYEIQKITELKSYVGMIVNMGLIIWG